MSLDPKLQHHCERLLADAPEGAGPRLVEDAQRLWGRVQRLAAMGLTGPDLDHDTLQLACYALQLPARQPHALPVGRLGQVSLRDRAEQSAELLIGAVGAAADESLLDRTARLLRELPQRSPAIQEARLLADALNLEDFGIAGLIGLAIRGGRVRPLVEGWDKRQQYGYWDIRLKEGFHFEPVRQMARQRLEHARQAIDLLSAELKEDQPA